MEHLGVLKNLFLGRGLENQSTRSWRKTSRSKGENQQQTQPTYVTSHAITFRTLAVRMLNGTASERATNG